METLVGESGSDIVTTRLKRHCARRGQGEAGSTVYCEIDLIAIVPHNCLADEVEHRAFSGTSK